MRWFTHIAGPTGLAASLVCIACGASEEPRAETVSGAGSGGAAAGSGGLGTTTSSGGTDAGTTAQGGTATSVGGSSGSSSGGTGGGGTSSGGAGGGGSVVTECDGLVADETPGSEWVDATGNLANMGSACGTLGRVVAKPCSKTVIASVTQHGLWSSDDAGATWTALGTGPTSDHILNHTFSLFFDREHTEVLWESGLHDIGGLFTTSDGGLTFKQLGTMVETQLVSVDFSDPDRRTLVAGTHGKTQQVYHSSDGGENWTNIGLTLPAEASNSESPLVIDENTYLLGVCNSAEQGCGFYRTTDAGLTWSKKAELEASHFGAPLWASDGAIYWPLQYNAGLGKSTDLGETWNKIGDSGVIVGLTPIELPDGSIVVIGMDHLLRSKDGGTTWTPIGSPLPFSLASQNGSVTYSALQKSFFLSQWLCADSVAPNSIMRSGYDYASDP